MKCLFYLILILSDSIQIRQGVTQAAMPTTGNATSLSTPDFCQQCYASASRRIKAVLVHVIC